MPTEPKYVKVEREVVCAHPWPSFCLPLFDTLKITKEKHIEDFSHTDENRSPVAPVKTYIYSNINVRAGINVVSL